MKHVLDKGKVGLRSWGQLAVLAERSSESRMGLEGPVALNGGLATTHRIACRHAGGVPGYLPASDRSCGNAPRAESCSCGEVVSRAVHLLPEEIGHIRLFGDAQQERPRSTGPDHTPTSASSGRL